MKTVVLLSILFFLAGDFALAENITLEIVLPDELLLGSTYTSLFKIRNLDHVKGQDSYVNVTVFYQVNHSNSTVFYESNFSKLVNSYTSSSTGYFFVSEIDDFLLCGWLENMTGLVCKSFSVRNPLETPCEVTINISLDKQVYNNGEQVVIRNVLSPAPGEDTAFIIEYWVEDLFGEEVKKRYNTSNLNDKTFTPSISEKYSVFMAKNRLVFVSCGNTASDLGSSAIFAVRNQDYIPSNSSGVYLGTVSEKGSTEADGRIASFYTRTRKFKEEINLYANIKTKKPASLVLKGEFGEQWKRILDDEKIVFVVKAKPGDNRYLLEMYIEDVLVESKGLVVSLEGDLKPLVASKNESSLAVGVKNDSKPVVSKEGVIKEKSSNNASSLSFEKSSLVEGTEAEEKKAVFAGLDENKSFPAESSFSQITGNAAYESSAVKAKKTIPFILAVLVIFLLAILFSRKMR